MERMESVGQANICSFSSPLCDAWFYDGYNAVIIYIYRLYVFDVVYYYYNDIVLLVLCVEFTIINVVIVIFTAFGIQPRQKLYK